MACFVINNKVTNYISNEYSSHCTGWLTTSWAQLNGAIFWKKKSKTSVGIISVIIGIIEKCHKANVTEMRVI